MSDEPHRSTEIDELMASMAPDDPAYVVATIDPSDAGPGEGVDDENDADEVVAPAKRKKGNVWIEWLVVIAVAVTAALIVRTYVLQQFAVSGSSMYSTLHDGDRVLVNKLSYRMHDPRRGDVVVLKTIEEIGERDLIKRVIGLPGETVEYRSCVLYVDGRELVEPYLDPNVVTSTACGVEQAEIPVPDGFVFVMGDNRGGSKDSRDLGPISFDDLIGRAFVVIWPAGDWRWL